VAHGGGLGTRQVGDGARHLERAVRAARRPPQARCCGIEELGGRIVEVQVLVDLLALQRLVGPALACQGPCPRLHHALADGGAGLPGRCLEQLLRRHGGHLDMQVDAVQQRPAELALVARDLVGCATAGALGGAKKAARAGVHGRDHLRQCSVSMNHRNAISYARFSSGSQAKGSSIVRQREVFKKWLDRNPQFVASEYSRMDEGVSGYTSANLGEGKGLHSILQLIQEKRIVAGDALVVEAIDRLGRADFLTMVDVIGQILTAGVSIITLEDEREYTKSSVNTSEVVNLAVKIQSAHEFSTRLGTRITAAYEKKRVDARQGKPVKVSRPFWLKSGGELDREAAEIVKVAIDLYLNGKGTRYIAKHISPMHDRLKDLNPTTLKRWFSSRALIGEWSNKGDPIERVFERLLDDSKFYELQAELKRRTTTPGPADKYILSGMVFCKRCGAKFQTRRQKPKPTLSAPIGSEEYISKPTILYSNCKAYLQKDSCDNSTTWPYSVLEFIYKRAASEAMGDVAEGIALDSRSEELDALVASIAIAEERSETQEKLYETTQKQKYLDEISRIRLGIKEMHVKAEQLRLSISHQSTMDAVGVVQTFDARENLNLSHNQQVQIALDELSARPADDVANILKRYIKITIDGKIAYSPYDQISYRLIKRSQKHACYFLESSRPDDTIEDQTAPPLLMYYAVAKGGRSIQSARSFEELEEILA